jgi:two-component system, OmpR family, response regulator VicR
MAFLTVEKGHSKDIGKIFTIGENPVTIGRKASENNPDIVLHDDFVSRRHLEISFQEDCYRLRDLNSTNGTLVDKIKIDPEKYYSLNDGSEIGLGISTQGPRVVLRFKESATVHTARIEDVAQAAGNEHPSWIQIDEDKGEIRVDSKQLSLSRKEYDLLVFLSKRAGSICSKDDLISVVWPDVIDPGGVSDAAIDQLMHRLRMKIESKPSHPVRLINRKGFGYKLV